MEQNQISVALVGLSFGLEFLPIYLEHPDVKEVWIVEKNESLLKFAQERYGIPAERCTTAYSSVLENPKIDAIHLVTPPDTHASFSILALESGKHCGCTIPMGMSLEDLYAVIEARQKAQRNYMFMETTVFQREFFYLQELFAQGKLGKLQYLSCAHYQDMEGWPSYWKGFPPLMHPTQIGRAHV